MAARRKKPFCGHTINSLACQDKDFHWSLPYQWFQSLTLEQKNSNTICTTSLVNVGFIPEVFDFRELLSQCA
jgi:hypothetical protein